MIQTIQQHVLDILQADSRLIQSGTIQTTAWSGVTREKNGDTPKAGWVNLFDRTFEPTSSDHRPGVYLGMKAMQATDTLYKVCADGGSGSRMQMRQLTLPLIIAVQGAGSTAIYQAYNQRAQLMANIWQILYGHLVESGYWWQMDMPGAQGGPLAQIRTWESTTAQGNQAQASAFAAFPCVIQYTYAGDATP